MTECRHEHTTKMWFEESCRKGRGAMIDSKVRPKTYALLQLQNFKGTINLAPQQRWDAEKHGYKIRVSRGNVVLTLTDFEFHEWFKEAER